MRSGCSEPGEAGDAWDQVNCLMQKPELILKPGGGGGGGGVGDDGGEEWFE